jgi:hypothetical protein
MTGKSTFEDFPDIKTSADKPLKQVNIDSFSSSVVSIEGNSHAVAIVDCHSGCRWLYGIKRGMLEVIKRWYSSYCYSDIADICQKHNLVVVMKENAGENKSHEVMKFLESKGVRNYFSMSCEQ